MKVKWDDEIPNKAMFQTINQVADFPLIKNPVETTDFHAEIRKFDGFPLDVTGLTEQMFLHKKRMAAIILVGNYKLSLYRFLVVFSSRSGTYLVT